MMTAEKKSPMALLLLGWIFVGIPLSWGVYKTVMNSTKLFMVPKAQAQTGQK
jgi:hypothetical protein